jgi:hypothetical protein
MAGQEGAPGEGAAVAAPTLVVLSGGEVGAGYVRQLLRAVDAGRLRTRQIRIVDRNPACLASRYLGRAGVGLEAEDWSGWLDRNLDRLDPEDRLVPYHFAPHLFRDWIAGQLRARGARVENEPGPPPLGLPFEATTRTGERALSYASWVCPTFCIEPALCPHTRGPKDWSLAGDLEARPEDVDDRAVFRCLHFVYGVGAVRVGDLHSARDRFLAGLPGTRRYLVATASHCHALASVMRATLP